MRTCTITVPRSFIVWAAAIAVVVLACETASPKRSPAIDVRAAGCYAIEWAADTGPQSPGFRADSIRLDTALRAGGPLGPDSLSRALEPISSERRQAGDTHWSTGLSVRAWKPISPDSVVLAMVGWGAEVVWSFRLRVLKDSLEGAARFDTDAGGKPFMTTVLARRIPCGRHS